MPTLVYQYGLYPPIEEADRVSEQMHGAHRYYNRLIELERDRRKKCRAAVGDAPSLTPLLDETVDRLRAKLTEVRERIKAERKKTRKRSESPADRDLALNLKRDLALATRDRKALRADMKKDPEVTAKFAAAEAEFRELAKQARADSGVYWGTYLQVEAAIDAARKAPLWARGEPSDPRFRRWNGMGAVAVHIIHGISTETFLKGTDTRLQYDENHVLARKYKRVAGFVPQHRGRVRLRVASTFSKQPIFAEWPMTFHRPLPPEAKIRGAKVLRRSTAGRERWTLHLTLELPEGWRAKKGGTGRVGVDLGWRKMPDGVRVAYFAAENGRGGELVLPNLISDRLKKVSDLASIRDKLLNELKAWFVPSWANIHDNPFMPDPDVLHAAAENMALWKSAARFSKFLWLWKGNRFPGDTDVFEKAWAWRTKDRHLWTWQENQRRRTLLHRREIYRVFAARLAEEFGELAIEKFDLRQVALKKEPEAPYENETSRYLRQTVAVSELRQCLVLAFRARGGKVIEIPAKNSTKACHVCGTVEAWDAKENVFHACSSCQVAWDQDENAAKNILAWRDLALEAKATRSPRWAKATENRRKARASASAG